MLIVKLRRSQRIIGAKFFAKSFTFCLCHEFVVDPDADAINY